MRSWWPARQGELAAPRATLENAGNRGLVRREEALDALAHFGWQRRQLAGERAAEADAVRCLGELQIGLDVEVEQRHRGFRLVLVERCERGAETY